MKGLLSRSTRRVYEQNFAAAEKPLKRFSNFICSQITWLKPGVNERRSTSRGLIHVHVAKARC